jgi:hypothetical protein
MDNRSSRRGSLDAPRDRSPLADTRAKPAGGSRRRRTRRASLPGPPRETEGGATVGPRRGDPVPRASAVRGAVRAPAHHGAQPADLRWLPILGLVVVALAVAGATIWGIDRVRLVMVVLVLAGAMSVWARAELGTTRVRR